MGQNSWIHNKFAAAFIAQSCPHKWAWIQKK